jgi:hypothetical protein
MSPQNVARTTFVARAIGRSGGLASVLLCGSHSSNIPKHIPVSGSKVDDVIDGEFLNKFEQVPCPQTPSSSEQNFGSFRPVRYDYLFLTDRRTEMN